VAGATPLPKNGVAGPPPFWPRGGFGHPIRPVWGGRSHPQAFGGGPATLKATKKKKKKKKKNNMGLCHWGWPDQPQGPGVALATPYDHTQALRGGPATPNGTNPYCFFFFFFFFLVAFGVAGPPPKAWGGRSHPRFPFFFFFFSFLFFLKKKKIRNGPKLRRFGLAQNGVVLE
jgi:hypothetical protein